MAEWLRRGLQSLVLRFESGWRLQKHSRSGGGTVDTRDLKSLASWACGFDSRPEHHKKSSISKGDSGFFIIARTYFSANSLARISPAAQDLSKILAKFCIFSLFREFSALCPALRWKISIKRFSIF